MACMSLASLQMLFACSGVTEYGNALECRQEHDATHVPAVTISDKAFKADQLYFSNTVDPCKWLYCTQHTLQATAHCTVEPSCTHC